MCCMPDWRRFLILPECTFDNLHYAIQEACGWGNAHLFEFLNGKDVEISPPRFTMQRGLTKEILIHLTWKKQRRGLIAKSVAP